MSALTQARRWVRGVAPDAANRERDDFYPTPPAATRALLAVERFEGDIWEPACGDGAISRVLRAAGHGVVSSDLIDRGFGTAGVNFLLDHRTRANNIVTNPPFKLIEPFIHHALTRAGRKVVFLARLALLEGRARRALFESTPLARVWVFSGRLTIMRGGMAQGKSGGMIAYAWFVWEFGHVGPPVLGWVSPDIEGAPNPGSAP